MPRKEYKMPKTKYIYANKVLMLYACVPKCITENSAF